MIDHTGINVSNFEKSKEFYAHVLAPLGYQLLSELDVSVAGFGIIDATIHNVREPHAKLSNSREKRRNPITWRSSRGAAQRCA
jgi:catechol 2,3-dioxygenase-like lactoylglutathione lyase family enzyme